MTAPDHRQQLYRVDRSFETLCRIEFSAACSESQTVNLPVGLVFMTSHDDEQPQSKHVDAHANNAEDWAPLLIDAKFRFNRAYQDLSLIHI